MERFMPGRSRPSRELPANYEVKKAEQVEENVKSLEFFEKGVKMEINGYQLEILGEIRQVSLPPRGAREIKFVGSSGTINGVELSKTDLINIVRKFGAHIIRNGGIEVEKALAKQELESNRQDELRERNKLAVEEVLK